MKFNFISGSKKFNNDIIDKESLAKIITVFGVSGNDDFFDALKQTHLENDATIDIYVNGILLNTERILTRLAEELNRKESNNEES